MRHDQSQAPQHERYDILERNGTLGKTVFNTLAASLSRLILTEPGAAWYGREGRDTLADGYFVAFRAPEVVVGGEVTEKADVWVLGCTICTSYLDFHLSQPIIRAKYTTT